MCAACARGIIIRRVGLSRAPRGVSEAFAACNYNQPLVSALIKQLKYDGLKSIHEHCADAIVSHFSFVGFAPPPQALVVPVPLSRKRLRERGFNQSELIARRVAHTLSLPCTPDALSRTRHTTPQTEMQKRSDRLENVNGAFTCLAPGIIQGKTLLLVDDVLTTGATLSACAKALKVAGAAKVIALVVAA